MYALYMWLQGVGFQSKLGMTLLGAEDLGLKVWMSGGGGVDRIRHVREDVVLQLLGGRGDVESNSLALSMHGVTMVTNVDSPRCKLFIGQLFLERE